MGLGARRLYSDQPRKPGPKFNQDCNGSPTARRDHPYLPERHEKRGGYCLQARGCDACASRAGSTCPGFLSGAEAYPGHAPRASSSYPGDIRVPDSNSGIATRKGDCPRPYPAAQIGNHRTTIDHRLRTARRLADEGSTFGEHFDVPTCVDAPLLIVSRKK